MLGYLNRISFLGYDFQSYPNSQKISLNILTYPYISLYILSYPKISSGANSQMTPRTRKYTNLNAALVGSMNSRRYCGAEDNLEPTGVQMAFNHVCKIVLRTADLARMKPVNGRFDKAEPDLPHATQ